VLRVLVLKTAVLVILDGFSFGFGCGNFKFTGFGIGFGNYKHSNLFRDFSCDFCKNLCNFSLK
jgi:hypothetical protein